MDELILESGLASPWMNVAGFGGYLPQKWDRPQVEPGAFVTNPISALPRSPAHNRSVIGFPGGFLLHNGHPNPGIKHVLKTYTPKWSRLAMPVWAHVLPSSANEAESLVRELEGIENVAAIELGLPPGISPKKQQEMIVASQGELPLYVCVPLDEVTSRRMEIEALRDLAGVVISAPRGVLRHNGHLLSGRLFGPSLFPQLMAALCALRGSGLTVIAGCGIFSEAAGLAAMSARATGLQVDAWRWQF